MFKKKVKVAVISDTHGLLRPEVVRILRECDKIIHAGDFDTEELAKVLDGMAPMYMVQGNNDFWMRPGELETLRFEIEGVHFFVIHDRSRISEVPEGTDVVIFGHTHQYYKASEGGVLWLNPGSCGRKRFMLPLSMAVMTISEGRYKIEKINIK